MNHSDNNRDGPVLTRRWFLSAACTGVFIGTLVRPTVAQASNRIIQPDLPGDQAFIKRAFQMRQLATEYGDQPYGAVVVLSGRIVGQSWSRVVLDHDPTGHAEMSAIRDAARRLKRQDLNGAILYSSSRPCTMCEAAAAWSGVAEMIYGNEATRAGRPKQCR